MTATGKSRADDPSRVDLICVTAAHVESGKRVADGDGTLTVSGRLWAYCSAGLLNAPHDWKETGGVVNVVHSAEHALKILTPEYDLVVTGLRLPEMTGERFIQSVRAEPGCADLPVLVIAPDAALPESIAADIATSLRRIPFDLEYLVDYVAEAAGPGRFRN